MSVQTAQEFDLMLAPAGIDILQPRKAKSNSEEENAFADLKDINKKNNEIELERLASEDIQKSSQVPADMSDWLPDHFKKCQKRSDDGMPIVEMKNGECHFHLDGDKRLIEKQDRLQVHGKFDKKDFSALAESLSRKGWVPANVEGEDEFVKNMIRAMAEHEPPIPIAKETLTIDLYDEWERAREQKFGSLYQEYARKMIGITEDVQENAELILSPSALKDPSVDLERQESNIIDLDQERKDAEQEAPANKEIASLAIREHIDKLTYLRNEEDPQKIADQAMLNDPQYLSNVERTNKGLDSITERLGQIEKKIVEHNAMQGKTVARFMNAKIPGTNLKVSTAARAITFGKIKSIKTINDLTTTRDKLRKEHGQISHQNKTANQDMARRQQEKLNEARRQAAKNHEQNQKLAAQITTAKEMQRLINKGHKATIEIISKSSPQDMHKAVERAAYERSLEQKSKESKVIAMKPRQQKTIER